MAVIGYESRNRVVTNDRITRHYRIEGVIVEGDVQSFVNTLPLVISGRNLTDWTAEETDEHINEYDLTVNWGRSSAGVFTQDVDTAEFRFNYQMGSGKFKQSLSTIASYYDSAQLPFGAADYGGAINVEFDGGKVKVQGVDINPPPEVFTLSYRADSISAAYQKLTSGMVGKVNSASYRGYAAGELILVRCTGGRDSSGTWTIEFGFGYIPNVTDLPAGDITVSAKDGMDLLWVLYRTGADATAKTPIQKPAAAYVERIFERADFDDLNLPS